MKIAWWGGRITALLTFAVAATLLIFAQETRWSRRGMDAYLLHERRLFFQSYAHPHLLHSFGIAVTLLLFLCCYELLSLLLYLLYRRVSR